MVRFHKQPLLINYSLYTFIHYRWMLCSTATHSHTPIHTVDNKIINIFPLNFDVSFPLILIEDDVRCYAKYPLHNTSFCFNQPPFHTLSWVITERNCVSAINLSAESICLLFNWIEEPYDRKQRCINREWIKRAWRWTSLLCCLSACLTNWMTDTKNTTSMAKIEIIEFIYKINV